MGFVSLVDGRAMISWNRSYSLAGGTYVMDGLHNFRCILVLLINLPDSIPKILATPNGAKNPGLKPPGN